VVAAEIAIEKNRDRILAKVGMIYRWMEGRKG
jgi:hypothetical protein